ncbi:MAG: hypothetical protein QOI95_3009 [Acidimicrobiaceae bacterium]|jgi:predicted ATPase/class 3 adenylate cyclase
MTTKVATSEREELALPEGTVTFLFTDIEGSTRLFRRLGDEYVDLLSRHDGVLRASIENNNGVVVKTEGDAFFAAFGSASDALSAATDAQRSLPAVVADDGSHVLVRMGLHTGLAYPRNSDYVAIAVHQAARIAAAAHGGQIILSGATAGAAAPTIPIDIDLTLLGKFRLKDFDDSTPLFMVYAPGLGTMFPPLRAVPEARGNVPSSATSIIGRRDDLARVGTLLDEHTVVTIAGPGGAGKTLLAIEAARRALDAGHYDEAWIVDLTRVSDPNDIHRALTDLLGIGTDSALRDAVTERLADRSCLLVFDNCEHLASAVAETVTQLSDIRNTSFLLTSQVPVTCTGERVHRLDPLPAPPEGQGDSPALRECASVQLLVERITAVQPDFVLEPNNATAVASICRQLDGLPLALELAAARCTALSLNDLADRLTDRFRILRSKSKPERHQTLLATISWSYGLCSHDERALLRRLGVLAGSFTLRFAEWVASLAPIDEGDVLDLLSSLVDRSLVQIDDLAGRTRYRLLESVRAFAVDELHRADESQAISTRVLEWVLAEESAFGLVVASDRIDDDLDSIEAALHAGDIDGELALRAGDRLANHYRATGQLRRGLAVGQRLLDRFPAPTEDRARLLASTATRALEVDELDLARRLLDEAVTIAAASEDGDLVSWIAGRRGVVAVRLKDLASARPLLEQSLATAVSSPLRAMALTNLGLVEIMCDETAPAIRHTEQALESFREAGSVWQMAQCAGNLAEVWIRAGDDVKGARYELEALRIRAELGAIDLVAYSLVSFGRLAARQGRDSLAVELLAGADRLLTECDSQLYWQDRALLEDTLLELRTRLGADPFHDLWQTGAAMDADELIATALALR